MPNGNSEGTERKMTTTFSIRRLPMALVLAGAVLVSGLSAARAQQEISPEHLAAARSYVDMTDNTRVYQTRLIEIGLNVMQLLIQQDPALSDPVVDAIQTTYEEYLARKDDLYNQVARIYANRFTLEEMQEILDFFGGDVGQKLLANDIGINQDFQAVIGVWENNTQREFLTRVRAILREAGYEV